MCWYMISGSVRGRGRGKGKGRREKPAGEPAESPKRAPPLEQAKEFCTGLRQDISEAADFCLQLKPDKLQRKLHQALQDITTELQECFDKLQEAIAAEVDTVEGYHEIMEKGFKKAVEYEKLKTSAERLVGDAPKKAGRRQTTSARRPKATPKPSSG